MGKKKIPPATDVYNQASTAYKNSQTTSPAENEMASFGKDMASNYGRAVGQDAETYKNTMSGFQNYAKNANFHFNPVAATTPKELTEGYGYLREAAPGYREFAQTGGYSPADIQELRARGTAPIRSAYGNTMMELDRARSIGGAGGTPNYIAAASRAQRDMPGQMADAMTGVNAKLAEDIRSGRLSGLAGLSGIGSTMGGMAGDDANRTLQADLANQGADLQTQGMRDAAQRFGLSGQASLYGTTPGQSSMFGNQALSAYNTRAGMEQNRNQFGLGLMDAQMRAQGNANDQKGTPWWKTALSVAGTVAPYVAMAASSKNVKENIAPSTAEMMAYSSRRLKHDIQPVKGKNISKTLKSLPLYTWKYKGDDITHFGPIAEEFKEKFNIGDGKTLHLADVMGVVLASQKEQLNHV